MRDLTALMAWLATLPARLDHWQTPGVALVASQAGQSIITHVAGVADRTTQQPVTPTTRFYIGSITKSFTAAALGQAVAHGRLTWDDPLAAVVPSLQLATPALTATVTLRDLLAHRSGLGDVPAWVDATVATSRQAVLAQATAVPVVRPLRSAFGYSNAGYVLAGAVLEAVTGQTWEGWLMQQICAPLGMDQTDVAWLHRSEVATQATMYRVRNGQHEAYQVEPRPDGHELDLIAPAGSINTCVADLTAWLGMVSHDGAWQGQPVLDAATLQQLWQPAIAFDSPLTGPEFGAGAYGVGWVVQTYRGQPLVWHDGAQGSLVAYLPAAHLGVAILTNRGGSWFPFVLAFTMLDHLLGGEIGLWDTRWQG